MSRVRVAAVPAISLDQIDPAVYDAVIGSLGFETRSSAIPMALAGVGRRAAVPFRDRQEVAYEDNQRKLVNAGFELPDLVTERESVEWLRDWVHAAACDESVARVAVDVSSMTRPRIGAAIEALLEVPQDCAVEADLLYAPAEFRAPETADDPPLLSIGPVSGYYAGWWSELEAPLHAIIGLGYELERASSAIDHLEPASFEVLIPRGVDERYLHELEGANEALFKTPHLERRAYYAVPDPFSCFQMLEAGVHRRAEFERVALLPLGPKIFAACSLLVAALHPQRTQVIRVTAAQHQEARDQVSNDDVYGIRVVVRSSEPILGPNPPQTLSEFEPSDDERLR